jgi:hypothetical protein
MGGLVVDGRLRFLFGNERERLKTPTIVLSVLMQVLCVVKRKRLERVYILFF